MSTELRTMTQRSLMFRYNLRTLLIVLALGPPVLAGVWFAVVEYQDRLRRQAWADEIDRLVLERLNGLPSAAPVPPTHR